MLVLGTVTVALLQFRREALACLVLSQVILVSPSSLTAASAPKEEQQSLTISDEVRDHPAIVRLFANWKEQFGPVQFERTEVFTGLRYLHPQPYAKYTLFTDEVLSQEASNHHSLWLTRFSSPRVAPIVQKAKPFAYLMSHDGKTPSLVQYRMEVDHRRIVTVENANVLFLQIQVRQEPAGQADGMEVAELLFDWLSIGYQSAKALKEKMSIPDRLRHGDSFTNAPGSRVELIGDWRNTIVGFLAPDALCILLFKADGQRAQHGFPPDCGWLNRNLFRADGKTWVDPPRDSGAEPPNPK